MARFRFVAGLIALTAAALTCAPASAFFHLWRFTEFFSNADGSVQFIELQALANGENFSQNGTISSNSTGKVFTFPTNLTGSTLNKRLLVATPNFASLPGAVTPDFTLPSTNFFDPAGDTLTLFLSFQIDSKTFTSVPTDGVMSRHYNASTGATSLGSNSPTNFAGSSGSVNLSAPSPTGDYNGNGTVDAADYVLWRKTLDQSVTAGSGADGNANGTVDAPDYDFWRAHFGNTVPGLAAGTAAVPEPGAIVLALLAVAGLSARRRR